MLEKDDAFPNNSEFIEDVKIGDTGFTADFGYEKVVTDAKKSALDYQKIVIMG